MRVAVLAAICIALSAGHDNQKEPTITIDPDGEIPVVEGFGGNVDILEDDDVLVLTRDNFPYIVNSRDVILVEFYAPWCGHCKALAPDYSEAARELKKDNIPLGKVDATKEVELAKDHLISGYPTLKLFKKGQPVDDYSGSRTTQAIVEYMRMHADPNYKPPPSAVMVLTSANFSKTINSRDLILVQFYAPWCRHCKAFEPEYEGAAKQLLEYGIPLAKVDGPEEKTIADELGVSGYPTLMVFRKGRKFDYKGRRDLSGVVDYMKDQARDPSMEVKAIREVQNNMARTDATIIGYFKEAGDMFEEYMGAANQLRDKLTFLHTFDATVANHFKLKANSITVFMPEIYHSKYEDKVFRFTKTTATYTEIAQFIAKKSVPLVGQRTMANKDFKYETRPLVVVYYDVSFSHQYIKDTQFIRNKILPVADQNRDILFAISDEEEFEDELKSLGLEDSGESVNVAAFSQIQKFSLEPEDDFSSDVLSEFVDNFKAGKLKPYLKSQPIPKKQDGLVRVFVANNFEEEVMQSKKDVLIQFYAPWCGHCKKLTPMYKQLAKHLANTNQDVIVGKMDATANDVPPLFKVSGFPTLYFLRANEKDNPVPFSGERSLKSLKEFVEQESSIFGHEDVMTGGDLRDEL